MRLIDAEALITFMKKGWRLFPSSELQHTCDMTDIENAPTIDAEPVRHGHWRYDEALELEWCSECAFGKRKGDKRWYSYCPNCGAEMERSKE